MKTSQLPFLLLLVHLVACSSLVDPDSIPADDALIVTATDTKGNPISSLKGDGHSQAHLLAQLPAKANSQDVTYTTTGGHFVYNETKTIKELADSVSDGYRFARALLQSDSLKPNESLKVIYVTVEVAGTRQRLPLTFTH